MSYLREPFRREPDFGVLMSVNYDLRELLGRAGRPSVVPTAVGPASSWSLQRRFEDDPTLGNVAFKVTWADRNRGLSSACTAKGRRDQRQDEDVVFTTAEPVLQGVPSR